jgi:oxygen-independent coproporphyrinogen-3 oxidase
MLSPSEARTLDDFLERGPYVGYTYSYPHKTAYRPFPQPLPLEQIWRDEDVRSLFLYVHIPFCEMRCGFCNLFTFSQPNDEIPSRYLQALERQARIVRAQVPNATFAQLALGGGTPTYLNVNELERLFGMLRNEHGIDGAQIPISVEASPATIDDEKLSCLKSFGVDRLSVGIQSFNDHDAGAIGRPQSCDTVARSLDLIARHRFRVLNLDLVYGGETQTLESWMQSVDRALSYSPEEIYLYPLYVRPLTGLARLHAHGQAAPVDCYRAARDELLANGYEQHSLRMFRRSSVPDANGPAYRCQEDGMIGLGCGARSYTESVHYADRFAVQQSAVLSIIHEFIEQDDAELTVARHGIELPPGDRRRRYLILSLLLASGLNRRDYRAYWKSDPVEDFPEIEQLVQRDLASVDDERIQLTETGLENADAIGPWLYSARVRRRMEEFPWKTA